MQGASWITLFRRIPANLHDGLALTLTTGSEVVVQRLVKLDAEVIILRGRMAGTQDSGRLVVLPYSQLVAINFARRLTDADVEAIFGKNTQLFAADITLSTGSPGPLAPTEETDEPEEEAAAPAPTNGAAAPAKPALPSKAELLAKLRARLGDSSRPG